MMPDTATEWLTLIVSGAALATAIRGWLNSTATENSGKIALLQKDMTDTRQRLQTVEGELRHLPDKDGVHRLELAIADLRTEVVKNAAATEQSARIAGRVETFLMEHGKK